MNARTGTQPDYIEPDKFDMDMGITSETTPPLRNSKDRDLVSIRGKNLLSFCKANEVLIVNGRKVGDLFGSVTSFQWNGTGLVDYIISDYTIFDAIKGLCVGDFIPWLSDHCHITYDIELSNAITPSTKPVENLKAGPQRVTWDENKKQGFANLLKSECVKNT